MHELFSLLFQLNKLSKFNRCVCLFSLLFLFDIFNMCLLQYIQQIVLDAPYHYFVPGDVSLMRSRQKKSVCGRVLLKVWVMEWNKKANRCNWWLYSYWIKMLMIYSQNFGCEKSLPVLSFWPLIPRKQLQMIWLTRFTQHRGCHNMPVTMITVILKK